MDWERVVIRKQESPETKKPRGSVAGNRFGRSRLGRSLLLRPGGFRGRWNGRGRGSGRRLGLARIGGAFAAGGRRPADTGRMRPALHVLPVVGPAQADLRTA